MMKNPWQKSLVWVLLLNGLIMGCDKATSIAPSQPPEEESVAVTPTPEVLPAKEAATSKPEAVPAPAIPNTAPESESKPNPVPVPAPELRPAPAPASLPAAPPVAMTQTKPEPVKPIEPKVEVPTPPPHKIDPLVSFSLSGPRDGAFSIDREVMCYVKKSSKGNGDVLSIMADMNEGKEALGLSISGFDLNQKTASLSFRGVRDNDNSIIVKLNSNGLLNGDPYVGHQKVSDCRVSTTLEGKHLTGTFSCSNLFDHRFEIYQLTQGKFSCELWDFRSEM